MNPNFHKFKSFSYYHLFGGLNSILIKLLFFRKYLYNCNLDLSVKESHIIPSLEQRLNFSSFHIRYLLLEYWYSNQLFYVQLSYDVIHQCFHFLKSFDMVFLSSKFHLSNKSFISLMISLFNFNYFNFLSDFLLFIRNLEVLKLRTYCSFYHDLWLNLSDNPKKIFCVCAI